MSTSFKPLLATTVGRAAAGLDPAPAPRHGPRPVNPRDHGDDAAQDDDALRHGAEAEELGSAQTIQLADFQSIANPAVHAARMSKDDVARVVSFQSVRRPTADENRAREDGYSAGFAAGWAAASREERQAIEAMLTERTELEAATVARLEQLRSALTMSRETARALASPVLQMHADEVVMAAITLTEDLVGIVLHDARTRVTAALARALEAEEDAGIVRVRMHPDDVTHYHQLVADPEFTMALPEGVDLVADHTLQVGDAVTELGNGFVDARLRSALARVHEEFENSSESPHR